MSGNCCGDGVLSGAAKAWKGSEAFSWLYACVSCLCVWSQDQMEFCVKVAGSLPLFPSSFLSFFFSLFIFFFSLFIFLYLSPFFLFFHLYFFKQAKADTFLKQGYSFGWLELVAWHYAISPNLDLCVKVKFVMSGSPFECVPTPKSIKVFSWCSPLCSQASYVPYSS